MKRFLGLLIGLALTVAAAHAATPIGSVARIQGVAERVQGAGGEALAPGSRIYLDEAIRTGAGARLELLFLDGTRLTVGENARLTLDRYVYRPAEAGSRLSFAVAGAFRFVSGKLGKAPAARVSVRTPVATIGVRGTDFWGGPIDRQYGVFLIEGSVVVTSATGRATLSRPGSGVNIRRPGAAPGPVTEWPADKVRRAVATVTFGR
jgi:hypothetical protein